MKTQSEAPRIKGIRYPADPPRAEGIVALMRQCGCEQLRPWLEHRSAMPIGALSCVINGPTCGRPWSGPAVRTQLRRLALEAGVRRRFAPHQLPHAHAVEMAREGVPLNMIQRQLGHADLGVTSVYLQGIDNTEVISAIRSRQAPVMPASAGLLLYSNGSSAR